MKSAYTFILVIYSYFVFETVILCDRNIRKRQTEPTCPEDSEYACQSGQCIDVASTCDGVQDCSDGSDETQALCEPTTCPTYGFKCTYGACINEEGRCDGVTQCLDGSDEEECSSSVDSESEVNPENISSESTPTGSSTTESTTTESTTAEATTTESTTTESTTPEATTTEATTTESTTTESTTPEATTPEATTTEATTTESTTTPRKTTPWKTTAWKATTSPTTPWKTTAWKATTSPTTPWKTTAWKATTSPTTPWKTTAPTTASWSDTKTKPSESVNLQSPVKKKTCVIPKIEGTKHFYKDTIQNVPLSHGSVVNNYRIVEEDCEEGYYKTVPYKLMVCSESGQWKSFDSDTLCLKKCTPMVSDVIDIKCSLNGVDVNCSKPSEPGTILTQSCKVENAHNSPREQGLMKASNELLCLKNAKWSGQLLTTCASGTKLTSNRFKESVIAPWNVEIYKINNYGRYFRVCGGTLIAPNLVVTAAHCFWKKGLRRPILQNENNIFKTAVGKENTNISTIDNPYTQVIEIGLIYLKDSYEGPYGNYADDISIIVLAKNVVFSDGVRPAFIDWSSRYLLSNGDLGKMYGLGMNDMSDNGQHKSMLKLYTLPFIDRNTCQEMYTDGFEHYVTKDKFCTVTGERNLIGFGGSGLVYDYSTGPFLTGIFSVKDLHSRNSVAIFTSIKCHVEWIRSIYGNYVY